MADKLILDLDLERIVSQSLAPLPGDSPAGENARYDPLYDQVKVEIDKLTAMAAGEAGVDWEAVINAGSELLASKSKDFNIAVFLALGLFKAESYLGLEAGFKIILGLMDGFWDSAFPPARRMKARANVFNWIEERIGEVVADGEPDESEAREVRSCRGLSQKLADGIKEKVNVPVTGLSSLRGALQKWVDALPQPEPEPEEPSPGPAAEDAPAQEEAQPRETAPSQPAPAIGAAFETPSDLDSFEDGLDAARRLTNLLRAQDPSSPVAYRLSRVLKWDLVDSPPQADSSGQTQIPGPREEDGESLVLMSKASNWKDLAEEAESQFIASGTFNLDLQRMVHQALQNLGAKAAAKAVAEESARFASRLEGVEEMAFADGRPFAEPATRQWLAEAKARMGGGAGSAGPLPGSEPWRKKALELAGQGELEKALSSLQQAVDQAAGKRQVMERRLAAASLCLDYQKPAWALPILEDLSSQLEEIKLEQWAPDFFSEVYAGLVKAYQAQGPEGEMGEKAKANLDRARRRLFETDMALAAKLSEP